MQEKHVYPNKKVFLALLDAMSKRGYTSLIKEVLMPLMYDIISCYSKMETVAEIIICTDILHLEVYSVKRMGFIIKSSLKVNWLKLNWCP